ncbi:MAG: hypothetical protein PHG63_03935, partial [Candidatus Dojkabacteria bacterium]|nr:hypothetical protein [Candidatus Dojkabacteria bacterium]
YEDNVRESLSSEEPHRLRRGGVEEGVADEESGMHAFSGGYEKVSDRCSEQERQDVISRGVDPHSVEESLSFSKMLLRDVSREGGAGAVPQESSKSPEIDPDTVVSARQYLNRYVIAQLNDAILIIDQHAAAERIRFEKLLRDYEDRGIESQTLMLPLEIRMSSKELLFVGEYSDLFPVLGFEIEVHDDHVTLKSVPAVLSSGNHEELMRSVVSDIMEIEEFSEKDAKLTGKYRDSVIATMACHSSVRMNQRISEKEAANLVKELFSCRNAYACPHGRPIVWRLTPAEIDRHFDR